MLIAEGDAEALARELLLAADKPELLSGIAAHGAAAVAEKFEQGAQVRKLEDHYFEAMRTNLQAASAPQTPN